MVVWEVQSKLDASSTLSLVAKGRLESTRFTHDIPPKALPYVSCLELIARFRCFTSWSYTVIQWVWGRAILWCSSL